MTLYRCPCDLGYTNISLFVNHMWDQHPTYQILPLRQWGTYMVKEFVIAGNYGEFTWFCNQQKKPPNQYVYLTQPAQIRATTRPIVYHVGTWYQLPIDILEEISNLINQYQGTKAYVMEDGGIRFDVQTETKAALEYKGVPIKFDEDQDKL